MTLNDLADQIAASDPNLTKAQAKSLVEGVFAKIREAALKGEEASLPGFGKFKVQDKPARTARNPRTGESLPVPARASWRFSRPRRSRTRSAGRTGRELQPNLAGSSATAYTGFAGSAR
jgi:DNA-binding protein HU-beta